MPVIERTVTRDRPNRDRIVAHLELRIAPEGERLVGGISPGFSVTGEIYEARRNASGAARQRMNREPDVFGAITDEIAQTFPKLKLLCDLHLSDPDGVPMHAEANGWYWYAGSRPDVSTERFTGYTGSIYPHQLEKYGLPDTDEGRRQYCYRVACNLLRVDEIPDFAAQVRAEHKNFDEYGRMARFVALRREFTRFVHQQYERWASEAAEARAILESLPETGERS